MVLLSAIRPSEWWVTARPGRLPLSGRLEAGGIPTAAGIPVNGTGYNKSRATKDGSRKTLWLLELGFLEKIREANL